MTPQVAIIDCGAGNLHSVQKAFAHAGAALGAEITIATTPEALERATHIVLPGVGAFADCMQGLRALPGMIAALERQVLQEKIPFFGICVGMQMLFRVGREFGDTEGLGWFEGEVVRLAPRDAALPIPHMGWNNLHLHSPAHPVFEGIEEGAHAYFVHSFHAIGVDPKQVLASVSYGGDVVACVGRENIVATQYHPEKSQSVGLRMIENFLRLT
jgi:imidazole glycerol-phosphate synthase subunit HisH